MSAIEIISTAGFALVIALLFARPQIGIVALIAFYPLIEQVPRAPLPGVNAETALFVVAGAVTLMRFGPRLPPLRYSGVFLAFLIVMLMAWLLGSALLFEIRGVDPWVLFKRWKAAVFPSLFFLFAYWWISDSRGRRRALEAMTWSVAVIAISGLIDTVAPFTESGLGGRPGGLLEQPNNLGGLLAAFSLAAIPLMRSSELGVLRRGAYLGIYLLSMWVMLFSLSRGAWLGALAGHAVLLLFAWPRAFLAAVIVGALALPSTYQLAPEVVRERVDQTFEPQHRVFRGAAENFGSGAERIVFYQIGWEMFLESPIWGQGSESFMVRSPELGARYGLLGHKSPHSLIVRLASEAGLLGLGMLAWLGSVTCAVGFRLWRRVPDARWVGLTLLAVTASISASNLVHDSFLGHNMFGSLFWMLFGAAARADFALRRGVPAADDAGEALAPLPRWLVGRELRYVKPALAHRTANPSG